MSMKVTFALGHRCVGTIKGGIPKMQSLACARRSLTTGARPGETAGEGC